MAGASSWLCAPEVSGAAGWPNMATINPVGNSATYKPKGPSPIGDIAIASSLTDRNGASWRMISSTHCLTGDWEVGSVARSSAENWYGCFATVIVSQLAICHCIKDIYEAYP